ncbi:hypothetical protein QMZ05_28500 [Bradyrhizobium sp. INPA03-11B]|uniref:hypothetical protein n=1 Tax=Bradyrhizobium sp. INPA03-11B TaxID=418598 RepID=UPI00338F0B1A
MRDDQVGLPAAVFAAASTMPASCGLVMRICGIGHDYGPHDAIFVREQSVDLISAQVERGIAELVDALYLT